MELFLKVVQGAYAYLLIFLILIVSSLFLTLLWLIVKRTKESSFAAAFAGVDAQAPAAAPTIMEMANTAPAVNQAELDQLKEENHKLLLKVESLESETKHSAENGERAKALNEKVSYLESKLLEYEILQEEISALSSLKIENEQLKQKLVKAGISVSDTGAGLVDDTVAATEVPLVSTAETTTTPREAPMIVKIPAEAPPVTAKAGASGPGNDASDNLDSLLAEIDKLTADKSESH